MPLSLVTQPTSPQMPCSKIITTKLCVWLIYMCMGAIQLAPPRIHSNKQTKNLTPFNFSCSSAKAPCVSNMRIHLNNSNYIWHTCSQVFLIWQWTNNLLITMRRDGGALLWTKTAMKHLLSETKCREASQVQLSDTKVILNFQLITN